MGKGGLRLVWLCKTSYKAWNSLTCLTAKHGLHVLPALASLGSYGSVTQSLLMLYNLV